MKIALAAAITMGVATPAFAAPAGDMLFKQRCQMCHTNNPGGKNGMGPNLAGMASRTAGTQPGFKYSPKLAASGIKWSAQTLDQFLVAPNKMVPGTRMVVSLPDAASRKAIVDYLLKGK